MTIFEAVETDDLAALNLLIAQGADVNARSDSGQSALHLAAARGNLDAARALLDAGADPNAESNALMFTLTPLSLAVQKGHHAVADALIAAGAMGARTPLETGVALSKAVRENRPDLVRSLIAAGADIHSQTGGGYLLHAAAELGYVEMIRLLIGAGARLEERKTFWGTTPLMVAAEHGREEAVAALLAAGANVHAPIVQDEMLSNHLNGSTALLLAARGGHAGVVRTLLAAGAGRNATDAEGRTAAELAAMSGHDDVIAVLTETTTPAVLDARLTGAAAEGDAARVVALLSAGANPNAAGRRAGDRLSRPALSLAASGGHVDTVLALLEGGASVDVRTPLEGRTPLMYAAAQGHAVVIRSLLAAGADPNARTNDRWRHQGETALMFASRAGHIEAARALLEGGASVHVKDGLSLCDRESGPTGQTALGYAVRSDDPKPALVSLLLDAGAYPDARDESGGTPLVRAAFLGKSELIKRLLAAGADPNSPARDESGRTALEAAAMWDDSSAYQLLRDAGAEPSRQDDLTEALRFAVFRGVVSVVDRLLADGVDANAESPTGAFALTSAAMMGRLEIARKLLDHGADPNGGAAGSNRPLHRAAVMGHTDVVRLLLDRGADPNALDSGVLTPLLALAQEGGRIPIANASGLPDCARALLAAGADVHATADGRTALEIASERGFKGLVAILREGASGQSR